MGLVFLSSSAEVARSLVSAAVALSGVEGPSIERLLERDGLRDALRRCSANERVGTIVILFAIKAARSVLSVWDTAYPQVEGPGLALAAVERWARTRAVDDAEVASVAATRAATEARRQWNVQNKAAWAGRTASWAAMAPKYGWPAVTALGGAVLATDAEHVVAALAS